MWAAIKALFVYLFGRSAGQDEQREADIAADNQVVQKMVQKRDEIPPAADAAAVDRRLRDPNTTI